MPETDCQEKFRLGAFVKGDVAVSYKQRVVITSFVNFRINWGPTHSLIPPPVLWAQRNDVLYIKVALEDCKNPTIKLDKDALYFKGRGGADNTESEVTLEFMKEISVEESKYIVKDRGTEFVLKKKESGPYWARLLKDQQKHHWLKVDFNKWRDEDDSDDEMNRGDDLEEMMKQMGGLSNSSGGDLGDLDGEADSDDEELPDLE